MSQGPVYVQAIDGLLYKDPIISGEGWFVCFDDDEPPEIVMKKFHNTSTEAARRRADELLRGAGIGFKLHDGCEMRMGRSFPPKWKPANAASIFFDLLSPIPIPRSYGGVKLSPTKLRDTAYIFWHDFDTRAVLESVLGIEVDLFLASSAMTWTEQLEGRTSIASFLKEKLAKQHGWIADVTKENIEQVIQEHGPKLRIRWSSSNAIEDSTS